MKNGFKKKGDWWFLTLGLCLRISKVKYPSKKAKGPSKFKKRLKVVLEVIKGDSISLMITDKGYFLTRNYLQAIFSL